MPTSQSSPMNPSSHDPGMHWPEPIGPASQMPLIHVQSVICDKITCCHSNTLLVQQGKMVKQKMSYFKLVILRVSKINIPVKHVTIFVKMCIVHISNFSTLKVHKSVRDGR